MRRYQDDRQPKAIPITVSKKQEQKLWRQWRIILTAMILAAFGASLTLLAAL